MPASTRKVEPGIIYLYKVNIHWKRSALQTFIHQHKFAITGSLASLLLLLLIIWLTPIAFSGYLEQDSWAGFWYVLSHSGGIYGTTVLVLFIGAIMAYSYTLLRQRLLSFLVTVVFFYAVLSGFAMFNEYALKQWIKAPRPSLSFLTQKGVNQAGVEGFYRKSKEERQQYLSEMVRQYPEKIRQIKPYILSHWIEESGFSFPSGHTQNAFLLGILFALLLDFRMPGNARFLVVIPLLWACLVGTSRVAIGVHTKVDVTVGALMGGLIALTIGFLTWRMGIIKDRGNAPGISGKLKL